MIEIGAIPKGNACPRCGSMKFYRTGTEFFCLTCSLIVKQKLQ